MLEIKKLEKLIRKIIFVTFSLLFFVGCSKKDVSSVVDINSNIKEENEVLIFYEDNKDTFEYIQNYLGKNKQIHDVNTDKLPGWEYEKVKDYYIYYDSVEEFEINQETEMFIDYLASLKVYNLHRNNNLDDDKIYSYQIFVKSKDTLYYTLCIDITCTPKNDKIEKEKYGKKMYSEDFIINRKWQGTYSNIK